MNSRRIIKKLIEMVRTRDETIETLNEVVLSWHQMCKVDNQIVEDLIKSNRELRKMMIEGYKNG